MFYGELRKEAVAHILPDNYPEILALIITTGKWYYEHTLL